MNILAKNNINVSEIKIKEDKKQLPCDTVWPMMARI